MTYLIDFFLTTLFLALFWTVVIGVAFYLVLASILFRYWQKEED